jgi:phosphohistidine swiveling domain-containing protein
MGETTGSETLTGALVRLRRLASDQDASAVAALVEQLRPELDGAVCAGAALGDPALASCHRLRLLAREVQTALQPAGAGAHQATHLLVFRADGSQVLLKRRGPFKRLFAGKRTVSGCWHQPASRSEVLRLLGEELGLAAPRGRLVRIGKEFGHRGYLRCTEFWAVTAGEEKQLEALAAGRQPRYVLLDYSAPKRSLSVSLLQPGAQVEEEFRQVVAQVTAEAALPPGPVVCRRQAASLYVYVLDQSEEEAVLARAARQNEQQHAASKRLAGGVAPEQVEATLREADADTWEFQDWPTVLGDFERRPQDFALDLVRPYLARPAVVDEIDTRLVPPGRWVLPLDDCLARRGGVVGGKARNLHELRRLARQGSADPSAAGWSVPAGQVMIAAALECCLAGDRHLDALVRRLDHWSRQARRKGDVAGRAVLPVRVRRLAARIRSRLRRLKIPGPIRDAVVAAYHALGAPAAAVRSSSTEEDGRRWAAAGMGESVLRVQGEEAVLRALRTVWASLFADGFIAYRHAAGLRQRAARMAVILQPLIEPAVAGVLMSVDAESGRPGFSINARRGLGEAVVQGQAADWWLVGPDGRHVLEWQPVREGEPCLNDAQVLRLAAVGGCIHDHYRARGLAEHVDVEFAVAPGGECYVVQARPETSAAGSGPGRAQTIRTVDVAAVADGVPHIVLEGCSASAGAATGRLQVIDDANGFARVEPGVILVTPNTNNQWNAAFLKIAAIVTRGGNLMSHAAVNARECRIPAVVGADNALEQLRPHDGRVATLDARRGMVFLGEVPVVEAALPPSLWRSRDDLAALARAEAQEAERRRRTSALEQLRPRGQTFETALGTMLGKPNRPYCYLQLDVYRRAWERLPGLLHALFPTRPPVEAAVDCEVVNRVLCVPVREGAACLAPLMHHLDLADFRRLMRQRFEVFARGEAVLGSLDRLDAGNVETVVDCLVEALACMHLAFSFHFHFEERFVRPQLRCVAPEYQALLIDLAFWHDRELTGRQRRHVLQEKYIELAALVADIRSDPEARAVFAQDAVAFIRADLPKRRPELWRRLQALSQRYKHSSEDLRCPSDDDAYLRECKDHLEAEAPVSFAQLAAYCRPYLGEDGLRPPGRVVAAIRRDNPDLYRLLTAHAQGSRGVASAADLAGVIGEVQEQQRAHDALRPLLQRFPRLLAILSIGRQEAHLREDAHQLVCRWQRRLAPLLLGVGQEAVAGGILAEPGQVFDLDTRELIALVRDRPAPPCVGGTPQRLRDWERAERILEEEWGRANRARDALGSAGPRGRQAWQEQAEEALRLYRAALGPVWSLLGRQEAAARSSGNAALADAYRAESTRLQVRVGRLRDRLRLEPPRYPAAV